VGLTRAHFDDAQTMRVKSAFKILYRSKLGFREAIAHVKAEHGGHEEIDHLVAFLENSQRGIAR
jgi:UDP-N-acetylglucosamine acyltransferase